MATVEENLQRLTGVLTEHFPSAYMNLNTRLMNDEIRLLERQYKIELPAPLKPLYRWHNGQKDNTYPAFFFGSLFSLEKAFQVINAAREGIYDLPEGFFPIAGELTPAVVLIGLDRDGHFNGHPGEIVEIDFDCYISTILAQDLTTVIEKIADIYQKAIKDNRKLFFEASNKRKTL